LFELGSEGVGVEVVMANADKPLPTVVAPVLVVVESTAVSFTVAVAGVITGISTSSSSSITVNQRIHKL
jgi:hypothetical protein